MILYNFIAARLHNKANVVIHGDFTMLINMMLMNFAGAIGGDGGGGGASSGWDIAGK